MSTQAWQTREDIDLCDFEFDLLRSMCGLELPKPWGAAVGAALEGLKARMLVECTPSAYRPTVEGERVARLPNVKAVRP